MTDDTPPLTHQQRLELTAGDDAPPGWIWPSLALGAAWPSLIATARLDADLLRRLRPAPGTGRLGRLGELPGLPAAVLVGSALVLAVLFGFMRVGIHDAYTESWLFLALAVTLGLASPSAGVVLVLAFIPMDLLATITRGSADPLVPALAGQAVSWWLLALLVVAAPLIARQVPAAVLASMHPVDDRARRALGYAGGAAVAAALAWIWCAGTVELIRPVFTWSAALGSPSPATTGPLLAGRVDLMVLTALVALAVTLLRDTFRIVDDEADADVLPAPWPRILPLPDPRLTPLRWVLVTAVGLVLLGGMITAPVDVILLGAALLAARPGVHWLLRRAPAARVVLGQLSWIVRFAIGVAVGAITALVLTLVLTGPAFGSERFPIVVATAVAIVILALLLEVDAVADSEVRASSGRAAAKAASAGTVVLVGLLALPALALAQGTAPCPVGEACLPPSGVSAAAAIGAAALVTLTFGTGGRFVARRRDLAARGAAVETAVLEPLVDDGVSAGGADRVARFIARVRSAWTRG